MKAALPLICLIALAGCQPPLEDIDTAPPQGGDNTSGLVERTPDTCGASNYQTAIGQPRSVIPTLGVRREIRVVTPGEIITQEYNPVRMNFYVDGTGTIIRVTCG